MQRFLSGLVVVSLSFGSGAADLLDCGKYNRTQLPFCECHNFDAISEYLTRDSITCGLEKKVVIKMAKSSITIECNQMNTLGQCAERIPKIYLMENNYALSNVLITKPRLSSDDITFSMFLDKFNDNIDITAPKKNYSYGIKDGLVLNGKGSFYSLAGIYYRSEYTLVEFFHSNVNFFFVILNHISLRLIEYLEINKMTSIPDDALSKHFSLKKLIFSKNENLQLTDTLLKPLESLETLKLFDNIITNDITSDTFNALNKLTTLILINNNIKAIPDNLFVQTKLLEVVKVAHNNITNAKLPKMFLANLPELMRVDLSYSSLEEIPSGTFQNSTQIENIKLNNNKLKSLPANVFKDLVNLVELDLSCNEIKSLPESIFGKLSSLEVLNMNNNFIAVMKSAHISSLPALESLLMSQNQLTTFCPDGLSASSFFDLKTIDLSYNQLDFQSNSSFWELEALVKLNISHNNISRGDIFWSKSMELRSLDISYNNIRSIEFANIHSDLFIKSKDIVIDLTHNNISSLENFAYHQLEPIKGSSDRRLVLVANNPIICDCNVYDFVKYLKGRRGESQRSIVNLIAEDVQCAGPEDKENKQLVDLNEDELMCPFNEENWCPGGCSCQFRPYDKSIIVHCEGSSIKNIKGLPGKIHISQKIQSVYIESYEIHLENNNLTKLPILDEYVTKLYLKENRFTDLEVEKIPENITVLDVRGNRLEAIPKDTLEGILNKTQLRQIFISDNPLKCDCANLEFVSIVQSNQVKLADYPSVKCADGRKLSELAMVALCGVTSSQTGYVPSSHLAAAIVNGIIAGISLLVAAIIYYKYRLLTRASTTEEYSLIDTRR